MVADEILLLMGVVAVFPYMAEATVDWLRQQLAH